MDIAKLENRPIHDEVTVNGVKLTDKQADIMAELIHGALEFGMQTETYTIDELKIKKEEQENLLVELEGYLC